MPGVLSQHGRSELISVTEAAKKYLKNILENNVDNHFAYLRLTNPSEGQLGLGIDIEQPEDHAIEYEGDKLLLVDKSLADTLKGVTLDVDETADGQELVFDGI